MLMGIAHARTSVAIFVEAKNEACDEMTVHLFQAYSAFYVCQSTCVSSEHHVMNKIEIFS